jgi:hypothetical protein
MSYVRDLVDPNGTLPPVDLDVSGVQDYAASYGVFREHVNIMSGDTRVGHCDLITLSPPYDRKVHFDGINIDDDHRGEGRGYGLSAYVAAIEIAHAKGLSFETQDDTQSVHAKHIWEILAATGAAVVVEEFTPSIYEGKFVGKYIVPVKS